MARGQQVWIAAKSGARTSGGEARHLWVATSLKTESDPWRRDTELTALLKLVGPMMNRVVSPSVPHERERSVPELNESRRGAVQNPIHDKSRDRPQE